MDVIIDGKLLKANLIVADDGLTQVYENGKTHATNLKNVIKITIDTETK